MDVPGSYGVELNKILALNNLPTVKVPDMTYTNMDNTVPPSASAVVRPSSKPSQDTLKTADMSNTSQPTLPLQQTNANYASLITREDALLIEICLGHARMRNMDVPGSYGVELNKILTLNNLPTVKVPDMTYTNMDNTVLPSASAVVRPSSKPSQDTLKTADINHRKHRTSHSLIKTK